jgi:hypothetical protein
MALPDYLKPTSQTSLDTGIAVVSPGISNGNIYVGAEIDNRTTHYGFMAIEAVWQFLAGPTANRTVEIRILENNGNGYETDNGRVIATIPYPADTNSHSRVLVSERPLRANRFKLAVRNVDTEAALTVTLYAYAYDLAVEE